MPKKINITSETIFDVKSGKISNPERYLIQKRDNERIEYPPINRVNGVKNQYFQRSSFFNDKYSEKFGSVIKDDFKAIDRQDFRNNTVNLQKWEHSAGLKIKPGDENSSLKIKDGALVFEGDGTLNSHTSQRERLIQTKNKVVNPTLFLNVLIGPYNTSADGSAYTSQYLKLDKPALDSRLKIQISPDGSDSTWQDIQILPENLTNINGNNPSLSSLMLSTEGYLKHPGVKITNKLIASRSAEIQLVSLKIEKEQFAAVLNEEFYLKIVETGHDNDETVPIGWAISDIKIVSRDQTVLRPGVLSGSLLNDGLISSPNFIDESLKYSSGSAFSNNNLNQSPNVSLNCPDITPFKDNLDWKEEDNDSFYNEGTSNNVYPGFNWHLTDKTKFEIDLSTDLETRIGYNQILNNATPSYGGTPDSAYDEEGHGQMLMAYWNNDLKSWEKVGQPLQRNFSKVNANEQSFLSHHTGACVGFAGLTQLFEVNGSNPNEYLLLKDTQLAQSNIHTDTWDFPYGPQYHATSSQYIKAKDLGITKPFLLEKILIECEPRFEFPQYKISVDTTTIEALSPFAVYNDTSDYSAIQTLQICTPTFFILKQSNKKIYKEKSIKFSSNTGLESDVDYQLSIPSYAHLVSGTLPAQENLTYVEDSRELITYAQSRLFVTASWATNSSGQFDSAENNSQYSVKEIIDAGLASDLDIIRTRDDHTVPFYVTESLKIKSNVKNTNLQEKISSGFPFNLESDNGDEYTAGDFMITPKKSTPSNNDSIVSPRSIVNGTMSTKLSNENLYIRQGIGAPALSSSYAPIPSEVKKHSPYLILPEDKLILGWQYPFANNYFIQPPHPGTVGFNDMNLVGKSKLVFYGSQVKNNKEFHEGLNQNLVTNNAHEVIGNEPVIDQWQIYTKGELYQSTADRFPFLDFLYGSHLFAGTSGILYGSLILQEKYRHGILGKVLMTKESNVLGFYNSSLSWTNSRSLDIHQTYMNSTLDPTKRITSHTFFNVLDGSDIAYSAYVDGILTAGAWSKDVIYEVGKIPDGLNNIFGYDFFLQDGGAGDVKKVYSSLEMTSDNPLELDYGGYYVLNVTEEFSFSSILLNQVSLTDLNRVYADSKSFYGDFLDSSWFGTGQSYFDEEKAFRPSGSPKYYFNSRGYGQFSHFEMQGRDSRFVLGNTGTRSRLNQNLTIISAPVTARFVETQYSIGLDNSRKKEFIEIQPELMDGSADSDVGYQSSNLKRDMSITVPFYDDNVARNRGYAEEEVVLES